MNKDMTINRNYEQVNRIVSKCMRVFFYILTILWVLCYFKVFPIDLNQISICLSTCGFLLLIPTLLINVLKINGKAVRYVVVTCTVLIIGILYSFLSYNVLALLLFPLLIASVYFDRILVLYATMGTSIMIIIANIINLYLSFLDIRVYNNISDALLFGAFPNIVIVICMSFIAYFIVDRNSNMINTVIDNVETLNKSQEELIYAFAEISENKSKNTGEHIRRVGEYMRILGEASGFSDEYIDKLATASMMHDIGKIMIPEDILDKPSKLTDDEYAIMKNHVLYGEALLMKAPGDIMQIARTIALQHHEKWDGTGYLGMKGEQISYIARLMAVSDVFDALTSHRYYKEGWDPKEAYNEIIKQSGKHFDPDVVQIFIDNYDKFEKVLVDIPDKRLLKNNLEYDRLNQEADEVI